MKKNGALIKGDIDQLRQQLYQLIEKENMLSDEVQTISCKLDDLIILYHRMQSDMDSTENKNLSKNKKSTTKKNIN